MMNGSYRFGFNGKEKDDEWTGSTGSTYDYGFRIYARIARFLSVDPLTKSYPWYTPYQFAGMIWTFSKEQTTTVKVHGIWPGHVKK